jgi:thiol-disulfide isomerase/thioredoxin
MKIALCFLLPCCFYLATSHAQVVPGTADSSHGSPQFNFVTLSGQQVLSANLKGKVIVLDFWSTDCNPCRKSMPQMEDFYRRYKNNPRVAVYLVNSGWESIDKARAFASSKRSSFLFFSWGTKYDLPFAYDSGSVTMKTFDLNSNPSTIIIDAGFRIRVRHSGYIEKFYDFLTAHVEQYLAEHQSTDLLSTERVFETIIKKRLRSVEHMVNAQWVPLAM